MTPLRQARIKTAMKQSDVSDIYSIPYRTYQNWELGLRKGPSYVTDRIITALNRLKEGEKYISAVVVEYNGMGKVTIPCKNRNEAVQVMEEQIKNLDRYEYARITAGSVIKYAKGRGAVYGNEIEEAYWDIR